jgi:hypothetical protein
MALITELHSELTAQRARIAQLTYPLAAPALASSSASAPPSLIPKKNKPPTFEEKSSPDSWIAHMTSYIHGLVVLEPACAAEGGETVCKSKGNKGNTRTVTIAAH